MTAAQRYARAAHGGCADRGIPMRRLIAVLILSLCALPGLSPPVAAQTAPVLRPMVAPRIAASTEIDYKAQYEQERTRSQQLREENDSLRAALAAWTSKGGSLVHAYCETPARSASSAGASNDCAASGYTCEPVSGLCRTSAANSSECASGHTWCVYGNRCVRSASDCKP